MRCLVVFLIALVAAEEVPAQKRWRIELGTGPSYNFHVPLSITQVGFPELDVIAHFRADPLERPILWVWRIGHWNGSSGWELEALHAKVFLGNAPPEVTEFAVSHGINFVSLNRAWILGDYRVHAGIGLTLSHPESIVRGVKLAESGGIFHVGYYVSGPAINLSIGRSTPVLGAFFITREIRVSLGPISVPVAGGSARFTAVVVQLTISAGWASGPHESR